MVNRAELLGTLVEKVSHILEVIIMVVMVVMIVVDNDPMMVHSGHSRRLSACTSGSDTASGGCFAGFLGALWVVMVVVRSTSSSCARHVIVDKVYLGEINQRIQNVIVRSVRVAWRMRWQYDRLRVVHGELGKLARRNQGLECMVWMVMVVTTGPGLGVMVSATVAATAATTAGIVRVLHNEVGREA